MTVVRSEPRAAPAVVGPGPSSPHSPRPTLTTAPYAASEEAGADQLRRLFRRHAATVSVITTLRHGTPVGLLVTSLASVSLHPPLLSFNVAVTASSWPALQRARHLGVHVLAADQEELARRFARPGPARFAPPTRWQPGPFRVPVLEGAAAWAVAEVERRIPAGDHVIVLARVLPADPGPHPVSGPQPASCPQPVPDPRAVPWAGTDLCRRPLLHHDGAYHRLSET